MSNANSTLRPKPQSPWWPLFLVAVCVTAILLLIRWAVFLPMRQDSGASAVASEGEDDLQWVFAVAQPADNPAEAQVVEEDRWARLIATAESEMGRGKERTRGFVGALFKTLDEKTPADRLAVLGSFFDSGADVDLGLGFAVGQGGYLVSWPTLRVALFDYLAKHDGAAARILAQKLLEVRPNSPAEWSLALRELARGLPASQWPRLVSEKLRALIEDPEWLETAPPGWAAGFDIIAAGGAVEFLDGLSRLTSPEQSRPVRFAAFTALDGLMVTQPDALLDAINQAPELFAESSGLRAGLFARADVRDPKQEHALEKYLGRADVLPGERAQFTAQFPRHRVAETHRLLTPDHSQTVEEAAAQDEATVMQVDRWLKEPSLEAWHASLRKIRARLGEAGPELAQRGPV